MMKKRYIEELTQGERVEDVFLVKGVKTGETRTGNPYLVLTLGDKTGEISGPVWEQVERYQELCVVGELVAVVGLLQSYRDRPQLKIDELRAVVASDYDRGDFVASSSRDRQEMVDELARLIKSVKHPGLRKLLAHFFTGSTWWERFCDAPAAKGMHHAYLGGLLEHCLSMAKVADLLAGHYPGINRCLLIAGALLHDIGKLEELKDEQGVVEYTTAGRLKGHLVMGSELVGRVGEKIKELPGELLLELQHLILSHHGRLDFGSPVVPATVEGLLLSYIDDLDAKMNMVEQLRKKVSGNDPVWSDYQRSLERYLYLGPLAKDEPVQAMRQPLDPGRQPTLF